MRWIIAALVVGLLTLAGCGTATASNSQTAGGEPIGTGKVAAHEFSGTTVSGAAVECSSLEGKPGVVWFWAPWCPTCCAQSVNVSAPGQLIAAGAREGEPLGPAHRRSTSSSWRTDGAPSRPASVK